VYIISSMKNQGRLLHELQKSASSMKIHGRQLCEIRYLPKKCRFPCKNHRVKMQFVGCHENVHIICYIIRCKEWSVCMSAGHKSEPTEMPFGLWTLVGPGNYVLDGP